MRDYPDELLIKVLHRPLSHNIQVPGSKSITNRALIMAALYSNECTLQNPLVSEDTEVMIDSLCRLGHVVNVDGTSMTVHKSTSKWKKTDKTVELFVENSGTSMRFLTAMVAVGRGRFRLDGVPRMCERPIRDLIDALNQIGAVARCEANNDCPPVIVEASGLPGGRASLRADLSSQYLSAILMAAPRAKQSCTIELTGTIVSEPYIDMTLAMMAHWGLQVRRTHNTFEIPAQVEPYTITNYVIEPDASAASYFFAAAAILGGSVTVQGMKRDMLQGDVRFVDALAMMGCVVEELDMGIRVTGPDSLSGITIDMNAISDTVPTLAAVACFATSSTTIQNVAHIRHKETDRIAAIATELRKLGIQVDEIKDGLTITPKAMLGCVLDTYNDHRMAMSLALIGLKVPGVAIRNPGCVAKTYPGFWHDFDRLRI